MIEKEDMAMINTIINDAVSEIVNSQKEQQNRITKDEIMAIKGRKARQKAIAENMDLFK